jgi:hypothetical protein
MTRTTFDPRSTRLARFARMIAVVASLALVVAACSGDDDVAGGEAGEAGTTTAASEPATPDEPVLVSAAWSFAECFGYCSGTVTFEGNRVTLDAVDREGPTRRITGSLDEAAVARLAGTAAAVDVGALEPTYGCPDCADGGAATLTFTHAASGGTVAATYDFGAPPPELAALDALTAPILAALASCEAADGLTIDPGCTPLD